MNITFEFATQDDSLDKMVPSDLRQLVSERDSSRAEMARLKSLLSSLHKDLKLRAEPDWDEPEGMVVGCSSHLWEKLCEEVL